MNAKYQMFVVKINEDGSMKSFKCEATTPSYKKDLKSALENMLKRLNQSTTELSNASTDN